MGQKTKEEKIELKCKLISTLCEGWLQCRNTFFFNFRVLEEVKNPQGIKICIFRHTPDVIKKYSCGFTELT